MAIHPDDPRHPFYWCRVEDAYLVSRGLRPIFCPRCIALQPCELHYPTVKHVKNKGKKRKKVKT